MLKAWLVRGSYEETKEMPEVQNPCLTLSHTTHKEEQRNTMSVRKLRLLMVVLPVKVMLKLLLTWELLLLLNPMLMARDVLTKWR